MKIKKIYRNENFQIIIKKLIKVINLINPFNIDSNNSFFYYIENFVDYKTFVDDINKYKLKNEEIEYLKKKLMILIIIQLIRDLKRLFKFFLNFIKNLLNLVL